jgi:hypothetical protein
LPPEPFEARRVGLVTVSSLSLGRFDGNDYSVPTRFAYQSVTATGTIDRVRFSRRGTVIAGHPRSWAKRQVTFDPLHYLALLERKPGALDHAKPLGGWPLPGCFATLRRRLEDADPGGGTQQYIRVLRLLETHELGCGDGRRRPGLDAGGHRRRCRALAAGAGAAAAGGGLRPGRAAEVAGGASAAARPGGLRPADLREGGEVMRAERVAAADVVLLKHHLTV